MKTFTKTRDRYSHERTLWFQIGSIGLSILATGYSYGQFGGLDDFNDGALDSAKWAPVIEQGATLVESSGRLGFSANGGTNGLYRLASFEWKGRAHPASNWMAQIDVRMPFSRPPSNGVWMGIEVTAEPWAVTNTPVFFQGATLAGHVIYVALGHGINSGRAVSSGSYEYAGPDYIDFDDHTELNIYSTIVSLRVRWHRIEEVLLTEYDANGPIDGYHWTILGCRHLADYDWNLATNFVVLLTGGASFDEVDSTPDDNAGFDSFVASYLTTPSTPPSLGVPAVEGSSAIMKFQSEPETIYTLESKETLASPDWHQVQTLLGDGSKQAITDLGPLPKQRNYRLSSP